MLRIRRHGRHEMPATPPPPEWASPLIRRQKCEERGEWVNHELDDWYRSLQRRLDRWLLEHRIG